MRLAVPRAAPARSRDPYSAARGYSRPVTSRPVMPRSATPRLVFLTTEGFPPTIFSSQVGDLLRVLAREGLRFEVIAFDPLLPRTLLSEPGRGGLRALRAALPASTPLRVRPYVPYEDRLGQPLAGAQLGWELRRRVPTVVHARGLWAAALVARLAEVRPWVRLVYDARGDYLAEHAFHHTGRGDAEADAQAHRILRAERGVVRAADAVLCVSEALADLLEARHGDVRGKVTVVPCGHDPDRFGHDPARRRAVRHRLGLGPRFTLIYAGSLVPYQLPGAVARAAALTRSLRPDAHLLALTPDPARAERVLRAAGLSPGTFTCARAAHAEMPGYLDAADAALLLRRRDPVNAVASPVKLAEYLACGLPVLVSDGIGDASGLVREAGLGQVVADPEDADALRAALTLLLEAPPQREHVARVARDRLARDRFLPAYRSLYHDLAGRAHRALR